MTDRPNNTLFGGMEGGASVSKLCIFNGAGKLLSEVEGEGTNIWLLGKGVVMKRIALMVDQAKDIAKVSRGTRLRCLCLSLSGAGDDKVNEDFKKDLIKTFPSLTTECVICSDAVAPVYSVTDQGAVVLISGTGSNCLLINRDRSEFNCGGWGHFLGDEGSAFWISRLAIKIHFDAVDKLQPAPHSYSTEAVWESFQQYLEIKERNDILPILYTNFNKAKFSRVCITLAEKANEGDLLCKWLFESAGRMLAKHIIAISSNASASLLKKEGGLPVVCVGSVWKSFNLLKPGITKELDENCSVRELSLIELVKSACIGAAYLAAEYVNVELPKNYEENYSVFFHYVKS